MSTLARTLTYEDLCRAREDGNRYELIEGELILVAAPSPLHQRLLVWLTVAFVQKVAAPRLGEVFVAPLDVRLSDGSIVQPDLIVVLADRSSIVGEALIEGAPSLIVEILSPSSRARDRGKEAALYARTGVPEYWIVDPEARSITVHAPPSGGRYDDVSQEGDLTRSVTVPGLTIDPTALFAGLPTRP